MSNNVKTYLVRVDGFDGQKYCARSRGKAHACCWREYCSYNQISFRDFLKISSAILIANPAGVGERILVGGEVATRILGRSDEYVWFMRDDSDTILCSHPNDVSPIREAVS